MHASSPAPIPIVVQQHVEDAAILRTTRTVLVRAPHVKLHHLRRLDDRLSAHLDGVAVAGEFGRRLAESALENAGVGEVFTAAVGAIDDKNLQALGKLVQLAEAVLESWRGLVSAFGWISATRLQGLVNGQLSSSEPGRQRLGITACAMHRVDPGDALQVGIASDVALLRARALQCAGEVGRRDLLPVCVKHLKDHDRTCAFAAAWAVSVLGGGKAARDVLLACCATSGPYRERAIGLLLLTTGADEGHALLKALAEDPAASTALIRATGVAGNTLYVPWLIERMADEGVARQAGEAFSLITGVDLALLDLEQRTPETLESGPNDNPEDENVEMDADGDLPRPDADKVEKWWTANAHRFHKGVRYFMGAPVTREHCIDVLKNGYQRERILAAHHLCLLNPGTPVFNTSAPAWRQQRLLGRM